MARKTLKNKLYLRFYPSLLLVLMAIVLLVFAVQIYRTAWLCDDAFITFRTVFNFLNGYGMRWNIQERVQSFTHPLWFFCLTVGYCLTGEIYYSSLALSMICTLILVVLLFTATGVESEKKLLAFIALLLSQAFVEYSTSGLENPLSHVGIATFTLAFFRFQENKKKMLLVSLLFSLTLLTRMELVLLLLPYLTYLGWRCRHEWSTLGWLLLGVIPFFLWELFSLVYYGFPFPNTAYAKLGAGIPTLELCIQGVRYLQNSVTRDPLTLIVIGTTLLIPFVIRKYHYLLAAVGIAAYMIYVVRIGGDFMSGRFLTPPFLFSVITLMHVPIELKPKGYLLCAAVCVGIGLSAPIFRFFQKPTESNEIHAVLDRYLIADERRFYYPRTGLALQKKSEKKFIPKWRKTEALSTRQPSKVLVLDTTGISGYLAGPQVHIIDIYALSDPLLARLPATYLPKWRIGHFTRHAPEGYYETLSSGKNMLKDPHLAQFYDRLTLVVRGPLFSWERIKAIIELNVGALNYLIDYEAYRFPLLQRISFAEAQNKLSTRGVEVGKGGLHISLPTPHYGGELSLEIEGQPCYLLFVKGEDILGLLPEMPASVFDFRGLGPGKINSKIPYRASRKGYDALRIMPVSSSESMTLKALVFSNE